MLTRKKANCTCCGGTSNEIVRMSTTSSLSTQGRMKSTPSNHDRIKQLWTVVDNVLMSIHLGPLLHSDECTLF